jgi:heme oxygenase
MLMPNTSPSIMARLRDETKAHHERAENRELQRALGKGSLPRDEYAAMLGQRLLIHRVLERELRRLARSGAPFSALVDEGLFQESNLRKDLDALGLDPGGVNPNSATSRLIAAIEHSASQDPVALFGMYYVFEGSKNGARYLVRRVAATYGLKPGPGLLYLDPHGEQRGET